MRALLGGYHDLLETISDAPAILWTELEGHLRWLRVPAPRFLVRIFVVLHVSRCVSALKRSVVGRAALADDAGLQGDLKMLQHFEQSLPPRLRLAVIGPLLLLAALLAAYTVANFGMRDQPDSSLLGNLMVSSVDANREAAISASRSANFDALMYSHAAVLVAWSVALVIVPLLPALAVKRRLLAQVAGFEAQAFAALGTRRVHDIELDLVAQLLLVVPVPLIGIGVALLPGLVAFSWTFCAIAVVLTVLAGVELRRRYAVRHAGAERRHRRITRLSLLLVWILSIVLFIGGVFAAYQPTPVLDQKIGTTGVDGEMEFTVTAIQQDAACADPYRPLIPSQQFLRFVLDVSSTVEGFNDPEIANALRLRHWAVGASDGGLEKDIYMYAKCGDGTEAISQPIVPGTHTKTVVVINAPKPAAFLQLDVPNQAVWRWDIPRTGS